MWRASCRRLAGRITPAISARTRSRTAGTTRSGRRGARALPARRARRSRRPRAAIPASIVGEVTQHRCGALGVPDAEHLVGEGQDQTPAGCAGQQPVDPPARARSAWLRRASALASSSAASASATSVSNTGCRPRADRGRPGSGPEWAACPTRPWPPPRRPSRPVATRSVAGTNRKVEVEGCRARSALAQPLPQLYPASAGKTASRSRCGPVGRRSRRRACRDRRAPLLEKRSHGFVEVPQVPHVERHALLVRLQVADPVSIDRRPRPAHVSRPGVRPLPSRGRAARVSAACRRGCGAEC